MPEVGAAAGGASPVASSEGEAAPASSSSLPDEFWRICDGCGKPYDTEGDDFGYTREDASGNWCAPCAKRQYDVDEYRSGSPSWMRRRS